MKSKLNVLKRKTEMYKPKNIDPEFYNWFKENWILSGGLITPATAAKILNKTQGRISQAIKIGKFKTYKYENITFLSMTEIMTIANNEIFKFMNNEILEELNKIENSSNNKNDKNIMQDFVNQMQGIINKTNPLKT